jgi:hypothetical protein
MIEDTEDAKTQRMANFGRFFALGVNQLNPVHEGKK